MRVRMENKILQEQIDYEKDIILQYNGLLNKAIDTMNKQTIENSECRKEDRKYSFYRFVCVMCVLIVFIISWFFCSQTVGSSNTNYNENVNRNESVVE